MSVPGLVNATEIFNIVTLTASLSAFRHVTKRSVCFPTLVTQPPRSVPETTAVFLSSFKGVDDATKHQPYK